MKDLCLFYDSNYPNVCSLGLFDDADKDLKNIKNIFPYVSYKIYAVYSTKIQSLDIVARLFDASFHTSSDCSAIDGVLRISMPTDQVINWLQDIAKLTGTEGSLKVFSVKAETTREMHSEFSTNHTSFQTMNPEKEFVTSLKKAPNLAKKKPLYFIHNKQHYPVSSWKEFLERVLRAIDNRHSKQLRGLAASRNPKPDFSSYPCLSLYKESDKYEQLPKSGIYFLTKLGANDVIKYIKYIFKSLNIDANDLTFAYSDGKVEAPSIHGTTAPLTPHNETPAPVVKNSSSHSDSSSAVLKCLRRNGYISLGNNQTIAKESSGTYQFSLKRSFLKYNWTLILDDQKNEKYYIFEVPQNSINTDDLKWRKNHRKYYTSISIPYSDTTFTDEKSKKIRFDRYYKTEVNYSDKPLPTTHKKSNKEIETTDVRAITLTPLSQIPDDFSNHEIAYFEFQGRRYEAEHWKDALDEVVDYLYKKNPEVIYSLAYDNVGLDLTSNDSRNPFFSLSKSAFSSEDLAHNIKNTDIYFKTNYSVAIIVNKCIRGLLNLFHEDLDQLIFGYY